jgi:hypothetical protein
VAPILFIAEIALNMASRSPGQFEVSLKLSALSLQVLKK